MTGTGTGKVYLIGAGPGAVDLMTLRAVRMLQSADAVVYDRLVSPAILALAPVDARMVPVGKAPKCHAVPQERINEILCELACEGLTVARLKGGDPLIFGRGSEEAGYLAARGIAVEYAPGITAAQGMAAATGVPLTHRGLATGVRYVPTPDGVPDPEADAFAAPIERAHGIAAWREHEAFSAEIALELMRAGLPGSLPVLAVAHATTPREARHVSRLDRIGTDMAARPMQAPVLFVLGHVVSLYQSAPLPFDLPQVMAGE